MDAFDMAQETFGQVKASWRYDLEAMGRQHSVEVLQEAFRRAKQHGAKDLNYVNTILKENGSSQQAAGSAAKQRLLCDGCGGSKWIDSMVIRGAFALCMKCVVTADNDPEPMNPEMAKQTPTAAAVAKHWGSETAGPA